MKKIYSLFLMTFLLILSFGITGLFSDNKSIIPLTSAFGEPLETCGPTDPAPCKKWRLIDKTHDNNFKLLKGTPFKFSFYNKLYNYFRLTDDGALVFGISPDNNSLSEGIYLEDKNEAVIKSKIGKDAEITFTENKTRIILPAGKNYINVNGQYKISDGTSEVDLQGGQKLMLSNGEIITSHNGLYGIKVDNVDNLEDAPNGMRDNVKYDSTGVNNYVMISPGFINLDMTKNPNHGIYEKSYYDSKGNLYAVGYMWYGYVEGTTKQVQYGIVLYNSTYYNNIRLFYGDIDPSINTNVFAGMSNGNGTDVLNIAYSNNSLGTLSKKDDIVIDGSKIFQELTFPIGYDPDVLDNNKDLVLDYEERDSNAPYAFLNKPKSKYALKFNVKINTDKVVCQREYVTSDGGDTLRWGKFDSRRTDFDDVDTFCFSAETPGIIILDNASYAKGGYKTGQSQCVVNHLSLMGFNASSIGWNSKTDNNCWLTYKIKTIEKDLSLASTNPYNMLGDFLDNIDLRPVDNTKVINNQSIKFTSPKPIMVITNAGLKPINLIDTNFKPLSLDMVSSKILYLYGTNGTDSYVLYSANRGDKWQILKKIDNKVLNYAKISESTILLFFEDGTYMRNIDGGLGEWKIAFLPNYHTINDMQFISGRSRLMVGNEGSLWKTASVGETFEFIDLKKRLNLQNGEHLQSIDIYGSSNIWISTNRGNILYSVNGGETFTKKTAGTTLEYEMDKFEDATSVYDNSINNPKVGTYSSYIDKDSTTKSLKFENDYQYLNGCMLWNNPGQSSVIDTINKTNLEPYTVNDQSNMIPKGDLYIDFYINSKDTNKYLKTLTLEDDYGNKILVQVDRIFRLNGKSQKIGWNTVKVEIRDLTSNYYTITAPNSSSPTSWHFQNISKYTLSDTNTPLTSTEKIGIGKISFAPISNLTNVLDVNKFNSSLTNTSTRTCNTDNSKVMTNMIDGRYNLTSFTDTDGTLKGFLTLDIYVEDKNKWGINSIELGNDDSKKIIWSNIKNFSTLGVGVIQNGWNSFLLPFNNTGLSNIVYTTNKNNINYGYLKLFRVNSINSNDSDYNKYAIDNIRYSSIAQTNLKNIRFFNVNEGIAFNDDASFITTNNTQWGVNAAFSRGAGTNMSINQVIKIKGREVYAIGNDNQGWFTYYSLDKGKNNKLFFSNSGVRLKSFDMINFDDGLAVSENGNIYEFSLETD